MGEETGQDEEPTKDDVPRYELIYRMTPGNTLRYQVEHAAKVQTTISGAQQISESHSNSVKSWGVQEPDEKGQIRFEHTVEHVEMWSSVTGRQPVKFDSRTDEKAPAEYEGVQDTIGKPLSQITMDAHGNIKRRVDKVPQIDLGIGGLVVPMPAKPIRIGTKWKTESTVQVRLQDGTPQAIKTQLLYELKGVQTGVATIGVRTEVLTPVTDSRIQSQLMQKVIQGEFKFDIDAGCLLSKEIHWDESVVGFSGPDSNMKYVARFTERLVPEQPETARRESRAPRTKRAQTKR